MLSQADQDAVTRVVVNFGKAIAAYERRLGCGSSRFDEWVHGREDALTESEKRGAALFVGRAKCDTCHAGPHLTDHAFHNVGLRPEEVSIAFVDAGDVGASAGLAAAIDWLLRGVERRNHLSVHLVQRGEVGHLTPEGEIAAFRIAQEALNNVVRHAEATRCEVTLDYRPDRLVMSIADDGRGFNAALEPSTERRGLGLIGIRERVADVGGSITLDTAPGRGTRLLIELPAAATPQRAEVEEPEGIIVHDPIESTNG